MIFVDLAPKLAGHGTRNLRVRSVPMATAEEGDLPITSQLFGGGCEDDARGSLILQGDLISSKLGNVPREVVIVYRYHGRVGSRKLCCRASRSYPILTPYRLVLCWSRLVQCRPCPFQSNPIQPIASSSWKKTSKSSPRMTNEQYPILHSLQIPPPALSIPNN